MLAVLLWLSLLMTPAVGRLLSAPLALTCGALLVAAGALLAPRWAQIPGHAALARWAGADPFSGWRWIGILGLYVGLRLPLLLDPSFGGDFDCWRVVASARALWTHGEYQVSRFPGYPVPEIALSPLIVLGGPVAAKIGASAVGFGALFAFDRLGRALGARTMGLATATLATAPMFVIQSSNIMDYVFALAALLVAMLTVARGGALRGGLWIGLGFACRITTVIYGLPMLVMARARGASTGRLLGMGAVGAGLGLALFSPVLITYGSRFLSAGDVPFDLDHASTAALGATGVWPLLAVGLLLGDRLRAAPSEVGAMDRSALLLSFALGALLFGMLPLDAGYLLPPAVFALLLAAAVSRPGALAVLLLAGLVSLMTDEVRGSVAFERHARAKQIELYEGVWGAEVAGGVLVLSGGDLAVVAGLGADLEETEPHGPWRSALHDPVNDAYYLSRVSETMLTAARKEDRPVYLWSRSLDKGLTASLGYSLTERGAVVLGTRSAARARQRQDVASDDTRGDRKRNRQTERARRRRAQN